MVHINITTWTKRDQYLPIMLKAFTKQTLKPYKIILWLSREEYDQDNLPESILECVNKNLLTDIMWVDKNIYCHKRHECFKYFNDVYNVFIDDDIIYPNSFLEELIEGSKKHKDCITCFAGMSKHYNGTSLEQQEPTKDPSFYNGLLGCWMCIPPGVFPIESYEYEHLRNKYCPKCDESWLTAWCLKNNIKVNLLHSTKSIKQNNIDKTQDDALYNENKQRRSGVRVKERMLANAIKIVGVEEEAKKVWPNFDIDKTSTFGTGLYNEQIICAMTSWKQRISNVPAVMDSLLNNFFVPDKIVLTLSEEEFRNRVIPNEIDVYIKSHSDKVQLNWVKENTKVWKKILPVFKLYPKDCIISVDDDVLYKRSLIRDLWFKHLEFPNNPISTAMTLINGSPQHCGAANLDKLIYYGNILNVVDKHPEIFKLKSSDTFFCYMLLLNNLQCVPAGFFKKGENFNATNPWATTRIDLKLCWNFLNRLFNKKIPFTVKVLSKIERQQYLKQYKLNG